MPLGRSTKAALKRAVKRGIAWTSASRPGGVRILTYHSIGSRDHEMNVAPDDFRVQMEWLAAHARVIPLMQAAAGEDGVAITFDDGYHDNLTHAAPVLRALGLPASFFIVAGRVGALLDHDTDPATSALMTWDEIREISSGGFEIGSHTLTHRRLSALTEAEQRQEIVESARLIRDHLDIAPQSFAYPFGSAADYTEISVQLAREAGYACAVSNRYGVNYPGCDRWTLRRIWIDATDTLASFQAKVDGRLDALALLDSRAGVAARRFVNRLLHVR